MSDGFQADDKNNITVPMDWDALPHFNLNTPEARAQVLLIARAWTERYDEEIAKFIYGEADKDA